MTTRLTAGIAALLAVIGLAGFAGPSAGAEVLYHENWTNTGENIVNDQPGAGALGTTGWQGKGNVDGDASTDLEDLLFGRMQHSNATGASFEPSVNSNPSEADASNGFIFSNRLTGGPWTMWTEEHVINGSTYDLSTLSFRIDTRNNEDDEPIRIAVQIDGDWYASEAGSPSASTSWDVEGRVTADASSSTWVTLNNFDNPSLGTTPTSLPTTGDITAFGVFAESRSDTVRLDNFHIEGNLVPEPGSLSLLVVGAAAFLRRRR